MELSDSGNEVSTEMQKGGLSIIDIAKLTLLTTVTTAVIASTLLEISGKEVYERLKEYFQNAGYEAEEESGSKHDLIIVKDKKGRVVTQTGVSRSNKKDFNKNYHEKLAKEALRRGKAASEEDIDSSEEEEQDNGYCSWCGWPSGTNPNCNCYWK